MGMRLTRQEAEEVLYLEARLLDEHRYEEWLELWAEDGIYWMPAWASETEVVAEPEGEVNLIYLDKSGLEDYVRRLRTGAAWAFEPLPRTSRLITNVMLGENGREGHEVFCNWLLQYYRLDVHHIFGGRSEYRLRRVEDGWRIAFKKVILINDLIPFGQVILV